MGVSGDDTASLGRHSGMSPDWTIEGVSSPCESD